MNKAAFTIVAIGVILLSLYILIFQGFGFPNISPIADSSLRILAACLIQFIAAVNIRKIGIALLPTVVAIGIALWGGYLFLTADAWIDVTFGGYFADFCTPLIGCGAAWIISKILKKRRDRL